MDMSIRIFLLYFCLLAVFKSTVSQNNGNCELQYDDGTAVTNTELIGGIDLTGKMTPLPDVSAEGETVYSFKISNAVKAGVIDPSSVNAEYEKFFTASVEGDLLTIKTSSLFPTIEDSITVTNPRISIDVTCTQGALNLQVTMKLKDTNNYPPTFDSASYTFNAVPMPFPVGMNIVPWMYQISVTDLDMTGQGVTMSLDSAGQEYFSVSNTQSQSNSKTFDVVLTTIKKMELTENLTFKLTATDKGTADDPSTLTSSVNVTIVPNVAESTFEPKFVEALYTATVTEPTGKLTFNEGDIMLSGMGKGTTTFTLSNPIGDYDFTSYISCESDTTDEAKVVCSWKANGDTSELMNEDYALIKVMGKQANYPESYTIIHLTLPGPPPTTTTTSTTVTTTTPEPCPTTTVCPECTTVTVTECDCPTETTTEFTCPTFDPTTMCPTESTSPSTDPTTSTTTDTTSSTDSCICPSDPATTCPTWTSDGGTTSSSSTDPTNTDPITPNTDEDTTSTSTIDPTNTDPITPNTDTTCPTFDPTTMCPTTDSCNCPTCEPCTTYCPSTDGDETTTSNTGTSHSTNDPTEESSTSSTDSCNCPTCEPTTGSSTSTDGDKTTSDTTDTSCPTFDPTTMCPSTGSTSETTCITECPIVCPTTETTGNETTSHTTSSDHTPSDCPTLPTECPSVCPSTETTDKTTTVTSDTSCPTFDPTTMCPSTSNTDDGTSTSSSEPCQCTFDPSTMCPSTGSTSETTCITECPTVCPTTEITDSSTSSSEVTSSTSTNTCDCSCPPSSTDPTLSTSSGTVPTGSGSSTGTGVTSESSTCPVCPTDTVTASTTAAPDKKLEFKNDYTVVVSSPQYNMAIVRPELKESVDKVEFSVASLPGTTTTLVEINSESGEVYLKAYPSTGEYFYQIIASVPGTELSGTATLTLIVTSGQVIDDKYVFTTRYLVVKASENKEVMILPELLDPEGVDCTFSSEKQSEGDFFSVDKKTGSVTLKSVDREDEIFGGAEEPAIQLTLKADCELKEETNTRLRRSLQDYILGEVSIPNLNSAMDIIVLIQDENDSPPIFTTTAMTVGYPTEELFQMLYSPSLGTVEATDADIGDNAKITYALDEEGSKLLTIHPTTGVLYPRQTSIKDEIRVSVTATDGKNVADPSLTITVRSLEEDNIFEMTVANKVLEDTDSILKDLSKQTSMDVRVLTSAVVPSTSTSSRISKRSLLREEQSSSALRLVLYALQKNKPVEVDDVQEKLEDVNAEWRVTKYDTSIATKYKSEDTTGYLAGIIVLAVLLVLVLGGTGVAAYLLIIKPRRNNSVDYDPFPRDSKEGTESNLSSVVPTIPPLTEDLLKKKTDSEDVSPAVNADGNWNLRAYENVLTPNETADWETSKVASQISATVESPDDTNLFPPDIPEGRKRSLTLYSEEEMKENADRRDESNDYYEVPDEVKDSEDKDNLNGRRKSVVTFNDNVDTIEIERL